MPEIELKFTKKNRATVAPFCPCGEPNNKKNPQFAPFEGMEQFGYCHRCDRRFMPDNTEEKEYTIKMPVKAIQKYISPEPAFNWVIPDAVLEPKPIKPMLGNYSITWYYRNIYDKLTGAKKMDYEFTESGFKRIKDRQPLHLFTRDSGYYPCLFYERDLHNFPYATVILVESEKTAAVLRKKFKEYLTEFIYLATGGSNGLTNEKVKVLSGRTVLICYDCDNGEKQPDGTIKSPRGREGAQSAHTKLAGISNSFVVDIDPTKDDGTDLADIETDIAFIRSLKGEQKYPTELIDKIRTMNREGTPWTNVLADAIAQTFSLNTDKIFEIGKVYFSTNKHEFGLEKAPLLKRIEFFLTTRYDFQRNSITKKIFYRDKNTVGSKFVFCNFNDIWRLLQHNISDINAKPKDIRMSDVAALLESDFVPEANPFHEYFHALPHWDGKDWITELADHVTTTDQPFWRSQFKKALIRMIACTYGHIENRIVMTLVQEKQETGKSNFVAFLCPPELKEYYKEDPMAMNKDTELALASNFIWNLDELSTLNRKEVSELKGVLSRRTIKQRRAYGRQEENYQRIVNFWGSTNKEEFLTDIQNTRWLCFRIVSVNHDYNNFLTKVKKIDITKVWAQAWYLYKSGEKFMLDEDERNKRDIINHTFEIMPQEKELIIKFLTPCSKETPNSEFITNVEILQYLITQTDNKLRLSPENVGRSMTQLDFVPGFKKNAGKSVRGYYALRSPLLNGVKHPAPEAKKEEPLIFNEVPGAMNNEELPF